jgi:hypothetical protein
VTRWCRAIQLGLLARGQEYICPQVRARNELEILVTPRDETGARAFRWLRLAGPSVALCDDSDEQL